jgi:hypothetical protein
MKLVLASTIAATVAVQVVAIPLEQRQACPNIHIFGARETTVPSGYGSAGTFVNLILNAYPGATAEVINYPAQGGSNGAYAASVRTGTQVSLRSSLLSYLACGICGGKRGLTSEVMDRMSRIRSMPSIHAARLPGSCMWATHR